jgi:glycosyltransferase involved in cell wall biosynthesis
MNGAMPRPSLSLIIITRDNARTLRRCLDSADFVDEKFLIDNGSGDETLAIAKAAGCHITVTEDFPGFSAQKQRALDQVTSEWVLALDADEWIETPLKTEMLAALESPGDAVAFDMPRHSSFCGRLLRHGDWGRDRVVRLIRRDRAHYDNALIHDRIHVDGRIGALKSPLLHEAVFDLDHALWRMNLYSTMTALERYRAGRTTSLPSALGHGFWMFLRNYILRGGFRDGPEGLLQALTAGEGSFYRYAKLSLMNRRNQQPPIGRTLPEPFQPARSSSPKSAGSYSGDHKGSA